MRRTICSTRKAVCTLPLLSPTGGSLPLRLRGASFVPPSRRVKLPNSPLAVKLPRVLTLCTHDGKDEATVDFDAGTITIAGRATADFGAVAVTPDGVGLCVHGRAHQGMLWSLDLADANEAQGQRGVRATLCVGTIDIVNLRVRQFECMVEPDVTVVTHHTPQYSPLPQHDGSVSRPIEKRSDSTSASPPLSHKNEPYRLNNDARLVYVWAGAVGAALWFASRSIY